MVGTSNFLSQSLNKEKAMLYAICLGSHLHKKEEEEIKEKWDGFCDKSLKNRSASWKARELAKKLVAKD